MTIELWSERFRPKTLDEYVWRDLQVKQRVEEWLRDGGLPHVLFSGASGTGKTSLALLLMRLLNIPQEDFLRINASRVRKVDDVQDKIVNFINAWAFNPSGLKYILLDEADKLSHHAQGLLRSEMDTYADVCRFIFTCNYPNKIIPALHGRLQEITFAALDDKEFLNRVADVLDAERVSYQAEVLMDYFKRTKPNLRKCLGLLQQNTLDGVLQPMREDDDGAAEYLVKAVELFHNRRYLEARKLLVEQTDPDEYIDLYRYFYQHLDLFGSTQDKQDDALLIIRKAIIHDGVVADREINVAACLCELARISAA